MGLTSALYSGVSGMAANGNAMSVVGNNIANSNTIGYKQSRTIFSDLLSQTISTSGSTSQIGNGVGLNSVDNIFSQGTFENTESSTDLAIEGPGFFIVSEDGTGKMYYTRAGSFTFDPTGRLINPEGLSVQGYYLDDDGRTYGDLAGIQVDVNSYSPGQATSAVTLTTNLDSNSTVNPGGAAFDIDNPADTSNYAASIQVYDSLGNTHLVTNYFRKTAANTWDYHTLVPGTEVGSTDAFVEVGTGSLVFDTEGELLSLTTGGTTYPVYTLGGGGEKIPVDPAPTAVTGALAWVNGSSATQTAAFTFNMSQYSSNSVVVSQVQDGYGTGNLVSLSIDNDGNVIGNFSTGNPRQLARVALAKFANPGGLVKEGGNLYSATNSSGTPIYGTVGSGVGKIFTNSLEQSNVDLAQEFVRMITIQRGFQANSRIITTTDEMMSELINLKR